MAYEINVDKYAFAETPEPEKVSEDYNGVLIRALVEEETKIRQASDSALEQSILNEVCARTDRDAEIKAQINTEILARETQGSGLDAKIKEEAATRASQDEAIMARLTEETQQRTAADASFLEAVGTLEIAISEEKTIREQNDTNISGTLSSKANAVDVYTKADVDNLLESKSDTAQVVVLGEAIDELNDRKEDRVNVTTDDTQSYLPFRVLDMYNTDYRCSLPLISLALDFADGEYPEDYISSLSFDSGETPTEVSYPAGTIINWVGTDCVVYDGVSVFQPSPDTHYEIVLYFNGVQFIGLVNGFVPAAGSEEA